MCKWSSKRQCRLLNISEDKIISGVDVDVPKKWESSRCQCRPSKGKIMCKWSSRCRLLSSNISEGKIM